MLSVVDDDHYEELDVSHPAFLDVDLYTERVRFHLQGTKLKDFSQLYANSWHSGAQIFAIFNYGWLLTQHSENVKNIPAVTDLKKS